MPRIYLSPPHLSGRELELVREAIESNWVAPLGPQVDAFERELAELVGVPNALALSSGTAALHLALVVLGIGPGRRGRLLVVDVLRVGEPDPLHGGDAGVRRRRPGTWTIDPALLDQALAERPAVKAVVAVDLYGQCCDYDALTAVCERAGCARPGRAESLGAEYRGAPPGVAGRLAAFSFNGNKVITTSGGGMLVSTDAGLVAHARKLSDPGARARAALRAHRDRVQLPPEQPPRRGRRGRSSRCSRSGSRRGGGSTRATASCSPTSPGSGSCRRRRTGGATAG